MLRRAGVAIVEHGRPHQIAITGHDRVRTALRPYLVGEQRRVHATEHHERAARARGEPDPVAAQRVPGVDADPHDVAGLDGLLVD